MKKVCKPELTVTGGVGKAGGSLVDLARADSACYVASQQAGSPISFPVSEPLLCPGMLGQEALAQHDLPGDFASTSPSGFHHYKKT